MNFYSTRRILFFILLQVKGIFSTPEVVSGNDITVDLNELVSRIFTIDAGNAIALIETTRDYYKVEEFEYNISDKVNHFQTKFFFQDIQIGFSFDSSSESHESDEPSRPRPQIHWKFSENEMSIFFKQLRCTIEGTIGTVKGEEFSGFELYPTFENFTISVVGSYANDGHLNITNHTTHIDCNDDLELSWYNTNLTANDEKQLQREIRSALPAILQATLNSDREFVNKLDNIFQVYEKPRKKIISKYPDFLNNPQQYYYLITETPFFCFTLKNISITGLPNFESYEFVHTTSEIYARTLLIKNLQGWMTLDYGCENKTALELHFQIDCLYLFVSKKDDVDFVHGHAKYYSVTPAKTNVSLSTRQSEVIVNGLETAIASSLLPTMRVGKIYDLETPLERIKISNVSDWKTIKESYNEWIPFNDNEDTKKQPSKIKSSVQKMIDRLLDTPYRPTPEKI